MRRAAVIVLDGLGIGPAPDTGRYGDTGSDTLGNVSRAGGGLDLPYLESLGLGRIRPISGLDPVQKPGAAWGLCLPDSAGKDSTTGHWEICGIRLSEPFPTYPGGFPDEIIEKFIRLSGRGVLGNIAASGTAILDDLGAEHCASGKWIVYTSADSVFQVAAHRDIVPLKELYAACETARAILDGPHSVSRIIARPFAGEPGAWRRTAERRDYSLPPPENNLLDRLAERKIPRVGIGKVDDLFAGRNITSVHTPTNADAYQLIENALRTLDGGFIFANVIEFDQAWGHRNDVAGFVGGLAELDRTLPGLLGAVRNDDLVILTADHGNDPTTASSDHSREVVPLLVYGPRVKPVWLGERSSFADIGQTVAEFLGTAPLPAGVSFLREVWRD